MAYESNKALEFFVKPIFEEDSIVKDLTHTIAKLSKNAKIELNIDAQKSLEKATVLIKKYYHKLKIKKILMQKICSTLKT